MSAVAGSDRPGRGMSPQLGRRFPDVRSAAGRDRLPWPWKRRNTAAQQILVSVSAGQSRFARPAGFEPATRCLEGSCSVRLSYGRSKRNCARRRSRDGYTKVAVCRSLTPCHLGKRQAASRRGLPNRRGYLTLPSGVELLQADQLDQRVARRSIGQLRVEARPAVTSESRSRSVVPLHAEQVPGSAQSLEVTGIHDLVPLGFAERQYPAGPPRL